MGTSAIVHHFLSTYIKFPLGDQAKSVKDGFQKKWNVPQCLGAIDGSRIPVRPPICNHTDHYNCKVWYSILIQAVVDHNYLFRDICVGWPVSVHDTHVYANSQLYAKATIGQILNGTVLNINGIDVPEYIIGDSAYPLSTFLMKLFDYNVSLSEDVKRFNYCISCARIVSENAFGRLKARWRRLMKQNDMFIERVLTIITACCILHNICEIHGDSFNADWLDDINNSTHSVEPTAPLSTDNETESDCKNIREALILYFKDNPIQNH